MMPLRFYFYNRFTIHEIRLVIHQILVIFFCSLFFFCIADAQTTQESSQLGKNW